MTAHNKFTAQVFRKDKTITILTLCPNEKFFYKIKEPKDLYWGLFCSPIAFFDIDGELIYHNRREYAQFGLAKKEWEIVSWSKSGNLAFFIERNSTKSLSYTLVDLENKKVSRTEYQDTEKDKWISELFDKLPGDKAQESYHKIISCTDSNEVFDYVLTLNLIQDKRELIKSLEQYYYNDFNKKLLQFEKGNFDEKIIVGSKFDNFETVVPDKINKSILEVFGIKTWRP